MIGVYYYPEQWPESQWERDIKNINDHGMQHIHLAEFSWIHLEPEEGVFDFKWLDRVIELAAKNNLGVILSTPTETPPIWMSENYPEICMVQDNLARVPHGSRANHCVNSAKFQYFAGRITAELGKRYGKHPAVIGWQIDNEIGHYENTACYCESCHNGFKGLMRQKYQTIEELNRNWGGDFWSQKYQRFSQIELPNPESLPYLPNEHCLLDFKKFFSKSLSQFLDGQARILRKCIDPRMWITHNFMKDSPAHFPGHVQAKSLDLYTLTIYPVAGHYKAEVGRELHRLGDPYNIALNHDQLRSYNGHWGIMEQQPGQVNWGPCNLRPYPGAVRLWLWTAVGHGAELLDTYRYRQPRCGAKQYHEGVVGLDGVSLSGGGVEFVKTAKELQEFEALLSGDYHSGWYSDIRVGLITDWDSLTALSIHPQSEQFDPLTCVQNFYGGLKKLGLTVDMMTPDQDKDLSSYSLICIALVDLASDAFVDRITTYVENGGHVVLSPRNFTRLENGHFPEGRYGYRFEQLTGATLTGYDVMPKGYKGSIQLTASSRSDHKISWDSWAEQVTPPREGKLLAVHADQFYQGQGAAFTVRKGEGRVSYIGFDDTMGVSLLLKRIVAFSCTNYDPAIRGLPENTLYLRRGQLDIFLNYNDSPVEVPDYLVRRKKIILGTKNVEPAGVVLLRG